MDNIIQFNREKLDIENLCKSIEALDLNIKNISAIIVGLNDKLLSKAGKEYHGSPFLVFENPDKKAILKRLQKHILFLNGLQIIFYYPEKGESEQLAFGKSGNYLGIRKSLASD